VDEVDDTKTRMQAVSLHDPLVDEIDHDDNQICSDHLQYIERLEEEDERGEGESNDQTVEESEVRASSKTMLRNRLSGLHRHTHYKHQSKMILTTGDKLECEQLTEYQQDVQMGVVVGRMVES